MQVSLGKKMGLLFRLLNKISPFLFREKKNFPLCVLFVHKYILRQHSFIQKTMLHVSQDGQRTRISHLNLFLDFQVKDLVKKIYTPDTQVEGSLGLLMWPHSSRDITGSCWFGHDEFLRHQMWLRRCRDLPSVISSFVRGRNSILFQWSVLHSKGFLSEWQRWRALEGCHKPRWPP